MAYSPPVIGNAIRGLVRASTSGMLRFTGPPPVNDEGAALDAHWHALATQHRRLHLPGLGSGSVRRARQMMHLVGTSMGPADRSPLAAVKDLVLPLEPVPRPARVYTPATDLRRPLVLFFHGGGFTIGGLASYDGVCRFLAARAGAVVLSVEYRLAPEHPFPAAVDDAVAALQWAADNRASLGAGTGPWAVCGDSAGGTLTAVACQQQRLRGGRLPDLQVPIYPATDLTCSARSHQLFADGFPLDRAAIDFFLDCYLPPGQDRRDPRVSPLFADDLADLPPALLVTAGHDILRDEGRLYANRLADAGVEVTHMEYAHQPHGFVNVMGLVPGARAAMEQLALAIGRRLA